MIHPTVDNLTVAANYLARSDRCSRLLNEIDGFIDSWDKSPRLYAGELAILNPLIILGVQSPPKYQALLTHVFEARAGVAETARMDYQRDLMRRIRNREASVIALHEHQRGRRLNRAEKLTFLATMKREWGKEKRRFVAGSTMRPRDAIRAFWDTVDRDLARDLREAVRGADSLLPAYA
jgi:hypothetical protein